MWEFSIELDSTKSDFAKYIFNYLKPKIDECSGIISSFEENKRITISIACDEYEKNRLQYHISDCISNGICTFLKESYLNSRLKLPNKTKLESHTFKKALVCFDKETDKFLINKFIVLNKNIVIESFFHFKLTVLKEKWEELVKVANDNSTYLLSDDSFLELLKFLIENIEFTTDEIQVVIEDSISIFDINGKVIAQNLDEIELVTKLFEISPRKIYWQSITKNIFLENIFEKRIIYASNSSYLKNENIDKTLQN